MNDKTQKLIFNLGVFMESLGHGLNAFANKYAELAPLALTQTEDGIPTPDDYSEQPSQDDGAAGGLHTE